MNSLSLSMFNIVTFVCLTSVAFVWNSLTLKVKSFPKMEAGQNTCNAKIDLAVLVQLAFSCEYVKSLKSFLKSFAKFFKLWNFPFYWSG